MLKIGLTTIMSIISFIRNCGRADILEYLNEASSASINDVNDINITLIDYISKIIFEFKSMAFVN